MSTDLRIKFVHIALATMSASITGSCYRLSRVSHHPLNMNCLNNSSVLIRTDASTWSQIKKAPRRNAWGFFYFLAVLQGKHLLLSQAKKKRPRGSFFILKCVDWQSPWNLDLCVHFELSVSCWVTRVNFDFFHQSKTSRNQVR